MKFPLKPNHAVNNNDSKQIILKKKLREKKKALEPMIWFFSVQGYTCQFTIHEKNKKTIMPLFISAIIFCILGKLGFFTIIHLDNLLMTNRYVNIQKQLQNNYK